MLATVPPLLQPFLLLILTIMFFWSMAVVHELGHVVIGTLLGGRCKVVWRTKSLVPVLATRVIFPTPLNGIQNALFTGAGIICQLAVSIVLVLQTASLEIRMLTLIYLAVIGVNIIPVEPSDGYHINLLMKQLWLQKNTNFINVLTGVQWSILVMTLIVVTWCYIVMFLWATHTGDIKWFELTVIGCIVVVRILLRVKNLLTAATFSESAGGVHE